MTDALRPAPRVTLAAGLLALGLAVASCRPGWSDDQAAPAPPRVSGLDQPPVPLDANPPVEYPADLYEQRVSGTVLLRLFVDASGTVVFDSSRIQESSGFPGLDSAALAAASKLHYAPALHNGRPVAAPFVQPVHFRHPSGGAPTP